MLKPERNPWRTVASRTVYTNPWITVREDAVIQPGGGEGIYGVVQARVATGVVAMTPSKEIYLVGQHRYPTNHYSWEIIEGGAERNEDPLLAAQRELREEAGLVASSWEQLGGEFHLSNCFSDEIAFLYLATDLAQVSAEPDDTEELKVACVPLSYALELVDSGEIKDSLSVIALLSLDRRFR